MMQPALGNSVRIGLPSGTKRIWKDNPHDYYFCAFTVYYVFSWFHCIYQILRLGLASPGDYLMMSALLLSVVVVGLTVYLTAVILFPEKF
jgi:K+-transporting ATPase KdpF subunit